MSDNYNPDDYYGQHNLRVAEFKSGTFWDKHQSERSQAKIEKAEKLGKPWCTVCGAALRETHQTIHIVGGGGLVLHPDDEQHWDELQYGPDRDSDNGDMGCWDVGPECARLIPAAFRSVTKHTPIIPSQGPKAS